MVVSVVVAEARFHCGNEGCSQKSITETQIYRKDSNLSLEEQHDTVVLLEESMDTINSICADNIDDRAVAYGIDTLSLTHLQDKFNHFSLNYYKQYKEQFQLEAWYLSCATDNKMTRHECVGSKNRDCNKEAIWLICCTLKFGRCYRCKH